MKKFFLVAVAMAANAFAYYNPAFERPLMTADLKLETSSNPNPTQSEFNLTLNQRDDSSTPTSLTFVEKRVVYCVKAPCPRPEITSNYKITQVTKIGCGSVEYTAQEEVNHTEGSLIKLVDHTKRICRDLQPNKWIVNQSGFKFHRTFVGNPTTVYSILTMGFAN